MTTVKIFLVLCFSTTFAHAQELFPDQCRGQWEGMMFIISPEAVQDSVPVRMTVAPIRDNQWTWRTEYLMRDSAVVKDYVLKLVDAQQRHYVMDEGDGIRLQAYQLGDKLYSQFAVQGSMLTATYQRDSSQLIFEITSSTILDTTQAVTNYAMRSLQRSVLRKTP